MSRQLSAGCLEAERTEEIDAIPTGSTGEPKRGEVTEAVKLIEAMTRDFAPDDYEDQYRARLLQLVEGKRKNKKAKLPEIDEPQVEPAPDLMAALKASLERARGAQ